MMAANTAGVMGWGMVENEGWRKGPWTSEEDRLLIEYVRVHGEGRWNSVARLTRLKRNGKSCRLRWVNYLRPDLKRGQITPHEESIILELHARWGNRWSTIARSLPGRTDNEIKNYWRTHFKKKAKVPSNDQSERSRTRLLRKQQFFQQQQQQYYHQLQEQQQTQLQPPQYQQQQQFNAIDMKRIISLLLDDGETKITSEVDNTTYPTTASSTTGERGVTYPMFNYSDASTSEGSTNDELLWDHFWNIEHF
ncbi:hypothetical protein RND81_05G154400 [Saponaria officinalis]|uniref:Uncharacterized protein n=1 Tax=Saponaria officinalis TaxID=3572 RepID=A0AAW1KYI2_SAPOF